jgi:site-specific DNA-methyltransferase (adenine-specific)
MSLYNDDCFNILPTLERGSVDFILVDPPFAKTALTWDKGLDWDKLWPLLYYVAKPNAAIAVFSSQPFTTLLINSNLSDFRYDVIWYKGRGTTPLLAKKQPMRSH